MPRKVEIPQSADTDYTDDDLYEITYTDGKSTRNNVMEQKISNLQIRVNDVFVMQKWMFLLNGFILVILISLIILFATNSSSGDSDVTATTLPSPPPTSASTTPPTACEDGWIDGRSVDLGCLFLGRSQLNYTLSVQYCAEKRLQLIVVNTLAQLDFARIHMNDGGSGHNWYAGATNLNAHKAWTWTVSGEEVKDFIWALGQPDNEGQNYVCFHRTNGIYGGHDCSGTQYPMCQKF